MEKGCWKLKTDDRRRSAGLLCIGLGLSILMGVRALCGTVLENQNELKRKEHGQGAYEQQLIAEIEGEERTSFSVTVEEQKLSAEEIAQEFARAEEYLNAVFAAVEAQGSIELTLAEQIPETSVEAVWVSRASEYFERDGKRREEVTIEEPVEVVLKAVLSCQQETMDYEAVLKILPYQESLERQLQRYVNEKAKETETSDSLVLPTQIQGKNIQWRKPLDLTFLYLLALSGCLPLFLKIGKMRDEKLKQRERQEQMEKDYPQIVSKFTMLLSAGLSIRNAWERIVRLYRRKRGASKMIYDEMSLALHEMEKGISEIEVYERFAERTGQLQYKKLMSLFVSEKKKGSISLPEAMNREMLQAWEDRKRKTRQQGELIGTKLLLPMMGMLAIVFVMILVPAFMSFQI